MVALCFVVAGYGLIVVQPLMGAALCAKPQHATAHQLHLHTPNQHGTPLTINSCACDM